MGLQEDSVNVTREVFAKRYERVEKDSRWRRDVESYDRFKRLFKLSTSREAKVFLLERMKDIEERWPHHKHLL